MQLHKHIGTFTVRFIQNQGCLFLHSTLHTKPRLPVGLTCRFNLWLILLVLKCVSVRMGFFARPFNSISSMPDPHTNMHTPDCLTVPLYTTPAATNQRHWSHVTNRLQSIVHCSLENFIRFPALHSDRYTNTAEVKYPPPLSPSLPPSLSPSLSLSLYQVQLDKPSSARQYMLFAT